MSGSNEERPTAADEVVEPATDESKADEVSAAAEPVVEMTAAEALAHATEAAEAAAEPTAEPTAATEAESEPEPQPGPATAARAPEEPEPAPDVEAVADQEPEAVTETEPQDTPAEAAAEPSEDSAPAAAAAPEATDEATASAEAAPEATDESAPAEAAPEATEEPAPAEAAPEATEESAPAEATEAQPPAAEEASEPIESAAPTEPEKPAKTKPAAPPPPDRPELRVVREALANREPLEGRVIGWNNGGFHLALGELSAFCPRSEMEVGEVEEPESYLDRTFMFRVLRLQGKGRRIVVSRAAHLRKEKTRQRGELRKLLKPGTELDGTVASLTDFGAFVDLGGTQGLVHVSEISHRRVEHPSHVLSEGQEVRVKVLKVEQGGRRISLSIRALEPDPWKDLADRFPRGAVVKGTVEKANQIGAFIELAPGLTGLLPAKLMSIPRETSPARAYPPGKEVSVQIVSIDPRRQRIALALEGSGLEGSRNDYQEYKRQRHETREDEGFNALASAFRRLQGD